MILKIDKMHRLFGVTQGHICKECSNLSKHRYDKIYNKCNCYGVSASQSTDWKVSNQACGLFNRNYMGRRAVEIRINEDKKSIKGQMSLF